MPYQLGDTPIRNFDNSLVFATSPILLYFLVSCFLFLVSCFLLPTNLASVPGLLTCPCYSLIRRPCSLQSPLPYYPNYYLNRSPKLCRPALFYLDRLLRPRGSISLNNFKQFGSSSALLSAGPANSEPSQPVLRTPSIAEASLRAIRALVLRSQAAKTPYSLNQTF